MCNSGNILSDSLSAEQKGSTKILTIGIKVETNLFLVWLFIVGCQNPPVTGQKDF